MFFCLAVRSTLLKSAIAPFSMDSTATLNVNALCAPPFSASAGGIQPTVATWPKPRCVPGGVSPLAPVAAGGADELGAAGGAELGLDVPPEALPLHAASPSASTAPAAHATIDVDFMYLLLILITISGPSHFHDFPLRPW